MGMGAPSFVNVRRDSFKLRVLLVPTRIRLRASISSAARRQTRQNEEKIMSNVIKDKKYEMGTGPAATIFVPLKSSFF